MKLIYKHSTVCPVSRKAKREVERFLEEYAGSIELEQINVIEERDRSNAVADEFGIPHESPQAILIGDDGSVIWSGSHHQVNKGALLEAVSQS